ncbi:amino acid adenylation domain-containing protein [Massilia sp. DJPM01]|uniref:non-ribosomal peptide synthetase n=1 Tax=Massilia sp. DJPM01 TaxID=3024404 RepID=UPI00259F6BC1|nr:non-ribosomal peptide synthetase [Massilia sp. DJPM01]MDM5179169.1 amino acid adenylation domain-containing protein [Massilia sp. DJPM01]
MMTTDAAGSVDEWLRRIEQVSASRCDLDVLLRDQWRHKLVPRDDGTERQSARRTVSIDGATYAALKQGSPAGQASTLAACALATLHSTLGAFGHGSCTVVAMIDGPRLLPTIVDHRTQAGMRCGEAVAAFADALQALAVCPHPDRLLRRSQFDTALMLAASDLADAALPPAPLVALVHDDGLGGLGWTIAYAADLFDEAVIGGLLDVVATVFEQYLRMPDSLVRDLALITDEQRRQLAHWNRTDGQFAHHKRLNELFEEAARRTPEQVAVRCRSAVIGYRELDERANQLAHWLLGSAVGAKPGERVGLYMDKSELGVIATLAIWKAGAAYVPIDPEYPAERVRLSIADTRPAAIICNRRHLAAMREILAGCGSQAVIVEIESALDADGTAGAMPCHKPALRLDSGDLAYITYTSGTTGVPKGVPKEHRSVVNSITDLSQRYDMREPGTEQVALFASYVFEPHLRQTLIALINGQTLVVVPDDIRLDPERLPAYLAEHRVTYLNVTGSVLQHVDLRRCTALKKLLLVGEELTGAILRRLREQFDGRIVNEYAFTESAFVTAIKEFAPGCVERPDRSIGRPLRNITWYILSQGRKPLPIGAIGELYIGGCGVAPGYLNQAALTDKAFFANPFQSASDRARGHNARIYRTGDLARMLPGGEVEYMGRADFQLKINGVRVEPGEIEVRAGEYPGVHRCVVVAHELVAGEPASRRLVGYFTADPDVPIAETDLLDFLGARLIKAMLPMRMIRLERIPLNINGKVDRRALPDPGVAPAGAAAGEPAPAPLRAIWSAVLGIPAAAVNDGDDFFHYGGQSISCIVLASRIRLHLGANIDVEAIFRLRTLGAIAAYLRAQGQAAPEPDLEPESGSGSGSEPNDCALAADPTPLLANSLQQGLLYHAARRAQGDDAYVVQSLCYYHVQIDPAYLQQAWQGARSAFPSLRLRFESGECPLQVAGPDDGGLDWRFSDASNDAEPQRQVALLREADRAEPYHPREGHLCRVYLVKLGEERFAELFSCHHLVIDGWSLQVLYEHVHRSYLALAAGGQPAPQVDHAYLAAQRYWQAHRHDHVDYWTGQLARIEERGDYSGLLSPASRYRLTLAGYDRVRERSAARMLLDGADMAALGRACREHKLTLHSVLQFAWHKALHAFGGGRTTVVGTIVSGRNMPIAGIETSVGLYINTLPLIVDHAHQATLEVARAIGEIEQDVLRMNACSLVELGRLQGPSMKRSLFDTLLVLENYPRLQDDAHQQQQHALLRYTRDVDADRVDHPLAAVAREEGGALSLTAWYAGEIMDRAAVETLLAVVRTLLVQISHGMREQVSALALLPAGMGATLDAWNGKQVRFRDDQTLSSLFEEVAAQWPERIALAWHARRMRYRELNEQANRMARRLRRLAPLHPDARVALVMDKGEAMIVAILALWKAGAAYVPIDPGYPDERIAFMLHDSDACLVLSSSRHAARLHALATGAQRPPVIDADTLDVEGEAAGNLGLATASTDLAYAIYTSGTTGKPKAVLVEHRGVVNLQQSLAALFKLDPEHGDEAMLTFSNYVFDHFVEVMTGALLNGQKLVLLDDAIRADQRALCRCINAEQVTYLSGTPSVLSMYDFSEARTLKRIDAIGEDLSEAVFARIRKSFPHGMIINGYGPTEISITSHKRLYGSGEARLDRSIGFPVANTRCHVLNADMQRVPIGGIGELYIGGAGVARGYLNRRELTAQRFIDTPFAGPGERLYRTGDLARWLPNGELEYLGRTDLQVKINGLRVELGEVEAALAACGGVRRALVITRERSAGLDGASAQKYIIGFYLAERDLDERELKRSMARVLPAALVPVHVLRITEIPVTASGKLDSARLPHPVLAPASRHDAPSDGIEARLRDVWSRVLGVAPERIGVHDDFFSLGGDSMRAMALAHAATSAFDCDVSVATIFQATTVASQARHIAQAAGQGAQVHGAAPEAFPLVSFAQERLLFIDAVQAGTSAYNIAFTLCADARCADALAEAVRTVLGRHAALRTLLRVGSDGAHRLHTLPQADALARFGVDALTAHGQAQLDEILAARAGHVFRLDEQAPLLAAVIRLPSASHTVYLSLVFHHTCFDGCSWEIVRRELNALVSGTPPGRLPAIAARYADYAVWQRRMLHGERLARLDDYWRANLAACEPLRLPCDFARPARFDYLGREIPVRLAANMVDCLRELSRAANVSLYSTLLAAWGLMLHGACAQRDLVIGTPFANRGKPAFAGVVGLMANLLAIRVRPDPALTLRAYLQSVGAAVQGAQAHADLPFERVLKLAGMALEAGRPPLAQVNFTLLPWSDMPASDAVLAPYAPANASPTSVKFELSVMFQETGDGLHGSVTYATSLFAAATVERLLASFTHVLEQFARGVGWLDSPVPPALLFDAQRTQLTQQWQQTQQTQQTQQALLPLHALFESQAAKVPDAIALVCGSGRLTYRELNEQANRLARQLRQRAALRARDLVALVLDKSARMVVAMLAVWKSGAAYVPIDPACPDARIAFLLEDTGARLVLANSGYCARLERLLGDAMLPVLDIDCLAPDVGSGANLALRHTAADLAYAIYTSGTSGQPKAVLVTHRNAASFHRSLQARYADMADGSAQTVLFLSNYVFDFSIEQIALSILSGHKLLIAPADEAGLYDCAEREQLTFLSGTPTQVGQFNLARFAHLRTVVVAGEAFLKHHFDQVRRQYAGQLYNAYGTTETTVYNTVRYFAPGAPFANDLGEPLSNTSLYVLDDAMQAVPPGECGQLHIAGECVTDGYLNRLALSTEHYVANHLQTDAERRTGSCAVLYTTGDLVRVERDGALRFMGRNDKQLKVRGLRIEPGEIEAAIIAFGGVSACAVVAQDEAQGSGGQRLLAYYLPADGAMVDPTALMSALRATLAPGTVPSQLVRLTHPLPVTINGKLDTGALPVPPAKFSPAPYCGPRDRLEARLCRMWAEQIPADAVGIDDDFFRSGGDSIGALRLASMAQRHSGAAVSVKQVFDFPTVRALAAQLRSQRACPQEAPAPQIPAGACPLLPIQRWFFAKPIVDQSCWNQHFVIRTGVLDADKLRAALGELVDHHDAFWLRFRASGTGHEQFYSAPARPVLSQLDVRDMPEATLQSHLRASQRSIDLEHGPLYCALYLHGSEDGGARVWFAMHHLIADVVSWRIITEDLEILYHGGTLGPRRATLRAWGEAVQRYQAGADERSWWSQLALAVARDKADGVLAARHDAPTQRVRFQLTADQTARLINDSTWAYETDVNDLLLTALAYALQALTGRASNIVTVEEHGREQLEHGPDVRDCVGWFTTMHPLPLEVCRDLGASLLRTRENRRRTPLHGLGYGAPHGIYGSDSTPLPGVSFNYLGLLDAGSQAHGAAHAAWRLDGACLAAPVGEAASDCAVDITMVRTGGQLLALIEARLDRATTQRFAEALEAALHSLIAHTATATRVPADRTPGRFEPGQFEPMQTGPMRFDPYVVINECAPGGTLFMLPPGEGGAESYLGNIAAQLPGHRLVVFNNLHLHAPGESFEALASYYVEQIEQLQGAGPYSLLGWSFGGVLAVEIANQLARLGKQLANLFIIDAYFAVPKASADLGLATDERLLDPINYRYAPAQADLDLLAERLGTVVLFKAEQPNEVVRSEVQRLLFAYYQDTRCNYLDNLLPQQNLRVEFLRGQTHHSWVRDSTVVTSMCRLIDELMEAS